LVGAFCLLVQDDHWFGMPGPSGNMTVEWSAVSWLKKVGGAES